MSTLQLSNGTYDQPQLLQRTFDSLNSPKYQITSLSILINQTFNIQLDQLSQLYGTKSAHQIAQKVVYGQKQTKQQIPKPEQSQRSYTQEDQNQQPTQSQQPSKLTLLSQQLYNFLPQKIEANKSQRAFYKKDQTLLLSPERLNSLPSCPVSKPMNDVTNRLIEFKSGNESRKEQLKDKINAEIMGKCTFQPEIDMNSRNLAVKVTQLDIRTADQFHEDQMKYAKQCSEKRELALERKNVDLSLQVRQSPQISEKSNFLSKLQNNPANVVARLHSPSSKQQQTSRSQDKHQEVPFSFKPEILPKSQNIQRSQPIDEYLFQDAKRRQETKLTTLTLLQTQQPISSANSTYVSEASISWFVQRFIKEFYFQLSALSRIQQAEQKDYSRLTYSETLQVLQGLNCLPSQKYFGNDDQIMHLSSQDPPVPSILSRNLLVILLAILAVPLHHTQIPQYKPHSLSDDGQIGESDLLFQQSRNEFSNPDEGFKPQTNKVQKKTVSRQIQSDQYGNLILNESDQMYLHQTFKQLYLNTKQLSIGNGRRRQLARSPQSPERLYSPQISRNSQQLSLSKRLQVYGQEKEFSLYDWFKIQENIKLNKINLLKESVIDQEMKQCTINYQELSKPLQKQEDRKPQDIEFERQQNACTFQPQISDYKQGSQVLNSQTQTTVQLQALKMAERYKEGRVRREAQQKLREKGCTTNNKIRGQAKKKASEDENISKQKKQRGIKSKPMCHQIKGKDSLISYVAQPKTDKSETCVETEQSNQKINHQGNETDQLAQTTEERVPLLFVDVNIEEGKTARIVVFDGDKSDELAARFSMEYNLDESMRFKLKELLDLQINSLLTKIDEDAYEENSDLEQD